MKRHPAIEQLSRDHHVALVLARRLTRAVEADAEEVLNAFLGYWRSDGREHFREEEEILLPTFAGFADPDLPIVAQSLIDHVRIRRLAAEVGGERPTLDVLHTLGRRLEQHVRREERELFPLIEQVVPESVLVRLTALLGP
jgi:iron-sulfur cluster repair protein YtfE (RIC family)